MSFRGVFITVFLGTALLVAAFMVNTRRPRSEVSHPTAALVRATASAPSATGRRPRRSSTSSR